MAAAAMLLSSCSGDGEKESGLTFQGAKVEDPGGALKKFEQNWRSHIAGLETPVRVAEKAKCYFQVMDKEITSKLLCGPFREASSKSIGWSSTGIFGYPPSEGKMVIGFEDMEGVIWDDSATPLPNAVPMTASGEKADLNQTVDEPDAPEVKVGTATAVDGYSTGMSSSVDGAAYAIDGGTWKLQAPSTAPTRYVGEGKDRRQAPPGASLLVLSVEHASAGWGVNANAARVAEAQTTLSVESGGKTITLPKPVDAHFNRTWIVSVPGNGRDAKLKITAAGGTQVLQLSDGKLSGPTAGWTPKSSPSETVPLAGASRCETASGDSDPDSGFSTNVAIECQLTWKVAPYVDGYGWAPAGMQWVVASIRPSTSSVGYKSKDSFRVSYKTTVKLTEVKLDNEKTVKPLAVRKTSDGFGDPYDVTDAVFQLKYGESPLKMTMTGDGSGTRVEGFSTDDAPKTWSKKGITGSVAD